MRLLSVTALACLATSIPVLALADDSAQAPITLKRCLVSLIDDVQVPSQEAGILVELGVREGQQVEKGMVLGRINDVPARLEQRVAHAEQRTARAKAENDVNVRYADATRQVAASEYEINDQANRRVAGTVSTVELQKLSLTIAQATLQKEQARHEQNVASLESEASVAKVELADDEISRREIRAPLGGEIVEVEGRVGQWLRPGDPVARVIRMDRLRVDAFVNSKDRSPAELLGKMVLVAVPLARGRRETFAGQIVFVDPRVLAGGDYRVRAEVENRRENDQWLLRPGLEADMTIDVSSPESTDLTAAE